MIRSTHNGSNLVFWLMITIYTIKNWYAHTQSKLLVLEGNKNWPFNTQDKSSKYCISKSDIEPRVTGKSCGIVNLDPAIFLQQCSWNFLIRKHFWSALSTSSSSPVSNSVLSPIPTRLYHCVYNKNCPPNTLQFSAVGATPAHLATFSHSSPA